MSALTTRLVYPLALCVLSASSARAEPPPAPAASEQHAPDCGHMLLEAAAALRNEQYPSMAQIAAERQRDCPGADSLFLLGLAKANMVHNGLVAPESELLTRAQAIHALEGALATGTLRSDWLRSTNAWLHYLRRLEHESSEARALTPPAPLSPPPARIPPAAPPFEPELSHTGPLLLASAGIVLLGAGVVTAIVASNQGPYDDLSGYNTATEVLMLSGGASLVGALTWYLLTPRPSDTVEVSIAPHVSRSSVTATLRMSF